MKKIVLILLILSTSIFSQSKNYTYQDIVKKIFDHNYKLKEIEEQIAQADILIEKSYTFLQPIVSANGRYTINDKETAMTMPNVGKITITDKYTYSFGANLNYTLLNLRALPLVKVAKKSKDISTLSKEIAELTIKEAVGEIFINILMLEEVIRVNELTEKNLLAHLELIKAKLEMKEVVDIEKLRLEVELAGNETQKQQTLGTIRQLKSTLAVMMGLDSEEFLIVPITFKEDIKTYDEFLNIAKANRKELKLKDVQLEIENHMLDNVYMQFYPNLALQAGWNWNSATGFTGEHDSWNINFVLNIPIYEGGMRFKDIKNEKSKIREIKFQKMAIEDDLKQEIKSIIIEIENHELTLKKIEREIELAKKSLELTEESYKLGVAQNIDVLDSTKIVQLTNLSLVSERLKLNQSYLKLKKTLGKL
ncbi:TolC family protein [bacterium]|nr:TolC family protein [bacterium]